MGEAKAGVEVHRLVIKIPGAPREELPREDVQDAVWRPGRVWKLLHVRMPQVPVRLPAPYRARLQLRTRRRQAPDASFYGRGKQYLPRDRKQQSCL